MTLEEAVGRIRELDAALVAALAEVATLREENRLLKERLGMNSQNSSKPPSSDGPQVKRPPASRKSGRRRGGQVGHVGRGRELLSIELVDEVVQCRPGVCAHCGEVLAGDDAVPLRHQVAEIPEPTHRVIEYRRHRCRCGRCGRVTTGALPAGVTHSRFGPRLHALVGLASGQWQLSKRQAVSVLGHVFGLTVSTGGITRMERRVSAALEAPYAEAKAHVQQAPVLHADETGWREAKSRAWLWVAATSRVAVFRIDRYRSGAAAKALVGHDFDGVLCVDRWGAYSWVGRRGLCWAHLMRDFQAMTERLGGGWHGRRLVLAGQRVLAHWKAWHLGRIDRATLLERVQPEREAMGRLLRGAAAAIWAAKKSRALCRQLLNHQDAMWRFLDEPDLPPTNNLAERSLRRPVIWRGLSFGTDSVQGSRFVERILTVVTSLKAQGRDASTFLVDALTAHAAQQPMPSLLPVDLSTT